MNANGNVIVNIFLIVLIFGGVIIGLSIILKNLMTPKKINALRTMMKTGNYKNAIRLCKEIIAKEGNNIEAHYYLGEAYYYEGKFELALIEYKAADKIGLYNHYVSETDLREKLADLYTRFENYDEALKEFVLLQQKNPDDLIISFKIGELFEKKNQKEQAAVNYTKALKVNQNFVPALVNLGVLLFEAKKYADSKKLLENAVRLEPQNNKAQFYLGMQKKAENNYSQAMKHFELASRDKDYKIRALNERGMILMLQGKYSEAVIELERALKNIDNDKSQASLNIRYILASCYEQNRNITEAIHHWEKIYSIKADFKDIAEKLASYQDLRLDDKMKDFMTATNEEFLDICKRIIASLEENITEMNILSSDGIEFYTLEGSDKWRNVKKKPKIIHIYRRSTPVDESVLRTIHESMKKKEIIKSMVLSSSGFSKQCAAFVQERPIELIDKNGLQNILKNINI